MDPIPQPLNVGQQWMKLSRRKRILFAVVLITQSFLGVVLVRWIAGVGPGVYLLLIPILVFDLLLILRPEWIARFLQREQERLEKWRPHPGQWMR